MSHAAVRQSGQPQASPAAPAPSAQIGSDVPQRAPEGGSDLALASAIAQAVRSAPGVVDLSPGLGAPVATYGPGQRVVGILLRRPSPEQIVVEIHVVLSESHIAMAVMAARDAAVETPSVDVVAAADSERRGPVLEMADSIRSATTDVVLRMAPLARAQVDVFIDDLR